MPKSLNEKKCAACEGGVPALAHEEIRRLLLQLNPDWQVSESGKSIVRTFEFSDFKQTMQFVNAVADIAESEGHHPDMGVHYARVEVEFSTHAVGGLTENDFICACKIDVVTKLNGENA